MHADDSKPVGTPRVFLCYARKDIDRAEPIVEHLRSHGVNVWIDRRDIDGALLWTEEIVKAIDQSRAVLFLWSRNAFHSDNTRRELSLAVECHRPILPVCLEPEDPPAQLRYQLAGIHRIEMHLVSFEEGIQQILRSLQRIGVAAIPASQEMLEVERLPGVPPDSTYGCRPDAGSAHGTGPGRRRILVIAGLAGLAVVLAIAAWLLAISFAPGDWTTLAPGIQTRCFSNRDVALSERPPFDLCVFRAEPSVISVKIAYDTHGVDVPFAVRDLGGIAGINGGYVDHDRKPSGWLVVNGVEMQRPSDYSGLLWVDRKGPRILWQKDRPESMPMFALQSMPLTVEPGGVMGIYENMADDLNARSVLCIDKRQRFLLIATRFDFDRSATGLTLFELANWLRSSEEDGGLDADACLEMDGGPMTSFYVRKKDFELTVSPSRVGKRGDPKLLSPTAIVIIPK